MICAERPGFLPPNPGPARVCLHCGKLFRLVVPPSPAESVREVQSGWFSDLLQAGEASGDIDTVQLRKRCHGRVCNVVFAGTRGNVMFCSKDVYQTKGGQRQRQRQKQKQARDEGSRGGQGQRRRGGEEETARARARAKERGTRGEEETTR